MMRLPAFGGRWQGLTRVGAYVYKRVTRIGGGIYRWVKAAHHTYRGTRCDTAWVVLSCIYELCYSFGSFCGCVGGRVRGMMGSGRTQQRAADHMI